MTTVFANGRTIIHKGDGLQFVAMAPDVCKTPSPGGPVPLPYPNIAMSSDLADATSTVKVEGNAAAMASANLRMSTGDEAGSAGGGVASNKIKGKLTWLLHSFDVKLEGEGAVRFADDNLHNGNMSNTTGKDMGSPGDGSGPAKLTCDNCGGDVNDAYHATLRNDLVDKRDSTAESVKGRTKAALTNTCVKKPFTGVAGDMNPRILNQNNFAELAKNFKHQTPIGASKQPGERNDPGNCGEQKALYAANRAGAFPPKPPCKAKMSIRRERDDGRQIFVPPCETCERVMASMLCEKDPKPRGGGGR